MEFEINAKGELIDYDGKMSLDCDVTLEGDIGGMICGVCCVIVDIAGNLNTTVEEVITEVYTHIKENFES